jgi:hypothetical protein
MWTKMTTKKKRQKIKTILKMLGHGDWDEGKDVKEWRIGMGKMSVPEV